MPQYIYIYIVKFLPGFYNDPSAGNNQQFCHATSKSLVKNMQSAIGISSPEVSFLFFFIDKRKILLEQKVKRKYPERGELTQNCKG